MRTTEVSGRVFDAYTKSPLENVVVTTKAGETVTDADGSFKVRVPAGEEATIGLASATHAASVPAVALRQSQTAYIEAHLVPFGTSVALAAESGGSVAHGDATVAVPAGAFATAGGSVAAGSVQIALAVLDPRKVEQLRASPGALVAQGAGGAAVPLSGAAMMDITATQGGVRLGIASGQSLTVDFPTFGASGMTKPLYSLDPATGKWVEEGVATRTDLGGGKVVFRASVPHLSWWAVAEEVEVACVSACVTHDGAPVADATYRAEGVGEGLLVTGATDEAGCFSADVGVGRDYRLRVLADGAFAETTFASPANAGGACAELGTIALDAFEPADGPAGSTSCGQAIVDTGSDPSHCGGCGMPCQLGQACVAGACAAIACVPPLALCMGECTADACTACTVDSQCASNQDCLDPDFDGLGNCAPGVVATVTSFRSAVSSVIYEQCACYTAYEYETEQECFDENAGAGLSPNLTTDMITGCFAGLSMEIPGVDWDEAMGCVTRYANELTACMNAQTVCMQVGEVCQPLVLARLDRCTTYITSDIEDVIRCLELPLETPCTLDAECQSGHCYIEGFCWYPPDPDSDFDGVTDSFDNCPTVPNFQGANIDGDFDGDACDPDIDGDGDLNGEDNCPLDPNPDQSNLDLDLRGDVCDFDDLDGDTIPDHVDNCPMVANPAQGNSDADFDGDFCDGDDDDDAIADEIDDCPADPTNTCVQTGDADFDGVLDGVDNCPNDYDPAQSDNDGDTVGDLCDDDDDDDDVLDGDDNCPWTLGGDTSQQDTDVDGTGDLCDFDREGDGWDDVHDNCPPIANPDQEDSDYDGVGDLCEG